VSGINQNAIRITVNSKSYRNSETYIAVENYPWSSHQGYLSDAKKWEWLYKDFVLSMFCDDKRLGPKRYREFVSIDSAEEINAILGKKKVPAMLGSEGFKERMKRMFSVEKRHVEVPESRSLAPDARRIRAVWCVRPITWRKRPLL